MARLSEVAQAITGKLDFLRQCGMPLYVTFNVPDYKTANKLAEYLSSTASNSMLVDAEFEFRKDEKKFSWPNLFEIPEDPSALIIIGQDKLDNDFYCKEVFDFYNKDLGNVGVYININQKIQGFLS